MVEGDRTQPRQNVHETGRDKRKNPRLKNIGKSFPLKSGDKVGVELLGKPVLEKIFDAKINDNRREDAGQPAPDKTIHKAEQGDIDRNHQQQRDDRKRILDDHDEEHEQISVAFISFKGRADAVKIASQEQREHILRKSIQETAQGQNQQHEQDFPIKFLR